METFESIIIGAGPAGMTAAIYLRRAGHSVLVLEQSIYGGQMASTPEVENYPAMAKVSGVTLSTNLYQQTVDLGAKVAFDGVERVSLTGETKEVVTTSGAVYTAPTVIIANGAKRRKAGVPGEEELSGKGVSYCATCDGGFFAGKTAVVIGGGNTAVEDALYLEKICKAVYIVHRRDTFRATKILADTLKSSGVKQVLSAVPTAILPREDNPNLVGAITVKNVQTQKEETILTDAVFVAIGLSPDNAFLSGQVALDEAGYIVAGEDTKTNLPGVFAAGDTRTKILRQIVTAAGDGACAANAAGVFLMERQ